MKSLQPLHSGRAPAGREEQASSIDDAPSCPRIYEELIQQLEADVRKHIRIEHQLKLHIESVEDRVEELERDMEKYEKDGVIGDQKDSKKKEYRGGHSKASSRASEAIDAAKYKAELLELKA